MSLRLEKDYLFYTSIISNGTVLIYIMLVQLIHIGSNYLNE